jgi:integrase
MGTPRGTWTVVEAWKHGRAWRDADGTLTFYIRKQIKGRRYDVSTGCSTLRGAMEHLERFEKDPEAYQPGGDPGTEPIYLDVDLIKTYLAWSLNDRGNTPAWVAKQKAVLGWWMERLRGVNLRRATLRDHVLPALDKAPARRHRMAVIKALFSWLRKERHLITSAEDCSLDLALPQIQPEQWRRVKTIPREHIDLVLEHLTSPWREALLVQAGTGWHTTEVIRFAAAGAIEPLPRSVVQEGVAGVLCCPQHKSGEPLRTRVTPAVLDAAKRLLAHGSVSREWYDRAVRAACAAVKRPDGKVGIPVFTPGRLRHSAASWAIEAGADPASVAAFLGHKSPRTTKRFYATHASPAKVPTLV